MLLSDKCASNKDCSGKGGGPGIILATAAMTAAVQDYDIAIATANETKAHIRAFDVASIALNVHMPSLSAFSSSRKLIIMIQLPYQLHQHERYATGS